MSWDEFLLPISLYSLKSQLILIQRFTFTYWVSDTVPQLDRMSARNTNGAVERGGNNSRRNVNAYMTMNIFLPLYAADQCLNANQYK